MNDLLGRATERRQLTVLFCDIVGSTGLSERCDPEDLSEILLEFQAISSRCINDAGGSVINYIGDGIRAEFGYPLASENEAESAVRAKERPNSKENPSPSQSARGLARHPHQI